MALHGLDPAGVEQTRTQHLVELLLEPVHAGSFAAGVVREPELGRRAAQMFHCGAEAPLELVVIIGIEQVMLPVVLVVEHHLHLAQASLQARTVVAGFDSSLTGIPGGSATSRIRLPGLPRRGSRFNRGAVTPGTPLQEGLSEVGAALPLPGIDQGLQAGPVGPWSRSIHAPGLSLAPCRRRQGIGLLAFLEGGHQAAGSVEPAHQLGEGITEQAGDAQGHIHPGPAKHRQGKHLQIHHAAGGAIPHRAHPHQGQGLADVLAAIAHRGGAPHREGQVAQVVALALQVLLQQQFSAAAAQIPSGLGGKTAQIHAVKVAARGEHIGAPAAGGAAGSGGDAAAGQSGEQGFPFGCGAGEQVGEEPLPQGPQHGVAGGARTGLILGLRSLWRAAGHQGLAHLAPQQRQSHGLQQGDGIAAMA